MITTIPKSVPAPFLDAAEYAMRYGVHVRTARRDLVALEKAGCPLVRLVPRTGHELGDERPRRVILRRAGGCDCGHHGQRRRGRCKSPARRVAPATTASAPTTLRPVDVATRLVDLFGFASETDDHPRLRVQAIDRATRRLRKAVWRGVLPGAKSGRATVLSVETAAALANPDHDWTWKWLLSELYPAWTIPRSRRGRRLAAYRHRVESLCLWVGAWRSANGSARTGQNGVL